MLRLGIEHIAAAAGTTQSEAVLWRDSETIAWRDRDVTAITWIAWEVVQLAGYRSIRKGRSVAEAASAPWPAAAACGPATATAVSGGMSSPPWSPDGVTVMSWPGEVIGRDAELGYVAALLAQLADGPAALIFAGEPGIGKTTMLLAAAESGRGSPGPWCWSARPGRAGATGRETGACDPKLCP